MNTFLIHAATSQSMELILVSSNISNTEDELQTLSITHVHDGAINVSLETNILSWAQLMKANKCIVTRSQILPYRQLVNSYFRTGLSQIHSCVQHFDFSNRWLTINCTPSTRPQGSLILIVELLRRSSDPLSSRNEFNVPPQIESQCRCHLGTVGQILHRQTPLWRPSSSSYVPNMHTVPHLSASCWIQWPCAAILNSSHKSNQSLWQSCLTFR